MTPALPMLRPPVTITMFFVELDEVSDLALIEIIYDGIVGFNIRIRITKCASTVGGDVENAPIAYSYSTDFWSL